MKKVLRKLVVVAWCLSVIVPLQVNASLPTIGQIVADFKTVFGQQPTHAEQEYWKSRRADKGTREALKGAMSFHKANGQTMPGKKIPFVNRTNEAFRSAFGRNPTASENNYWAIRVLNGDKTSYDALLGAMLYAKASGNTVGGDPTLSDDTLEALKVVVQPMFYNIYGSLPTGTEKNWWQRRIDCEELLTNKGLRSSMHFHFINGARIGSPNICKYALTPLPTVPDKDDTEEDGTAPVDTF